MSTEESLDLHTSALALGAAPEVDTVQDELAFAIDVDLDLAIEFPGSVEGNTLGHDLACSRGPVERAATNGGTVVVVGLSVWGDGFVGLVVLAGLGKVGVEFASTACAPHHASRPACGVVTATGALGGNFLILASVETGELSTLVEAEALLEEDTVREDDGVASGEVDGAKRVHRHASEKVSVTRGDGALVVDGTHREDAVGSLGVAVAFVRGSALGVEGRVRESHGFAGGG